MRHDCDDDQERLLAKAQRALVAMRRDREFEALDHMRPAGDVPDEGSSETRKLVLLLFSECSAMVAALGNGGSTPVKVQVFDSGGDEVTIDQVEPAVRTAVRTLLAEVQGNPGDAEQQVRIALSSATPEEVVSLMMQALRWTLRLAVECLERDLAVADWIVEALTGSHGREP